MKHLQFVARADDAGSSHSANRAIARVVENGIIRNVSVMAPGQFVDEAAQLLAGKKQVCFGMHATLNAEWDRVKWGPVSDLPPDCGLLDANGMFLASPKMFSETKPSIECILREYNAQLDKLTRCGFAVQYVDSHMFPEKYVPGLDEATAQWARGKGLLDHMYYYALPPGIELLLKDVKAIFSIWKNMPDGQYFYVAHPALDTPEMRMTGNAWESGEKVAKGRNLEARLFGSKLTKRILRRLGVQTIRYDEAVPLNPRITAEEIGKLLNI